MVNAVLTRAVQSVFRQRADADEIVPGLWVGSAPSSVQVAALVSAGIDAVVDLRAEDDAVRRTWPRHVAVYLEPLRDHGTPSIAELRRAAVALSDLTGSGRTVLVHCHAGVERAPTVACAALVLQGWSLEDAYRRVTEVRPVAAPTDGQLASVRALATLIRTD
ncbi:MAG: dual specificity protein phosphatase family protein [Candidatus Dormibacteraeota bacterium]|nr:dual specificity protein phosphatase family protein [Candidatus Dormibacteraeota bacterium]